MTSPFLLSLAEIASWHPGTSNGVTAPIVASVPALQRGLVWGPQQIEILWDSILRGFPFGALVVCPKIKPQDRSHDTLVTHHLLDGQQRCNAIALGFNDPFSLAVGDIANPVGSILWLDLRPELDRSSTRTYLARVTTMAHPWGYRKNDAADPLSTVAIRASLGAIGVDPAAYNYKRPVPRELFPHDAKTPVPLSWLIQAWSANDRDNFWERLAERAKAVQFPWTGDLLRCCSSQSPARSTERLRILRGIERAMSSRITVLNAPPELLEISSQEKTTEGDANNVTNVEHLFHRLNQQGTPLDGEELSYSMIKAYWPELAAPIDKIAQQRMPQARMVSLGVRAALAQHNSDSRTNLPPHPAVRTIREIAAGDRRKKAISTFIEERLESACDLVDEWLRYDGTTNSQGLLPVLVTSIAIDSRDVYLLLLHFANQLIEAKGAEAGLALRQPMQALATVLHWFSSDKTRAANHIYHQCGQQLTLAKLSEALQSAIKAGHVHLIHSPKAVRGFLSGEHDLLRLSAKKLQEWRRGMLTHRGENEAADLKRAKRWEGFLNVIYSQRELLLHAQRHFLARRFPDYDPARRDLWQSHNRPWDFDHILASKYVYNRKDNSPFRAVSAEWSYLIGNLRAWPFEDNRSDKCELACDKMAREQDASDSFVNSEEMDGFSTGDDVRWKKESAHAFIGVCRNRTIRIYREWYDSAEIARLLGGTAP